MRSISTGRILQFGLGVLFLLYGIYIVDPAAMRLMIFGLTLYALPLFLQVLKSPLVRAYALWFGVFLVAQGVLTPALLGDAVNLYHHVPNMVRILDAKAGVFAGGAGEQRTTTDELGFRVVPRVNYQQPADLRIFAIGGSTTEEFSINDQETWTHRVQQALADELSRHVEVINTGTSGALSQNHIATLNYIAPLHPDIALFLVGANDWNFDTHSEFGSDIQRQQRPAFTDTALGRLARTYYYRFFGSTEIVRADFVPLGGSLKRERKVTWLPDRVSDRYLANLKSIAGTCRARAIVCVFMTQPSGYQPNAPERLKDMFWMTPPAASYTLTFESLVRVAEVYNRALTMFGAEEGFTVCDLAAALDASTENFTDEMHFSFKGSARIAEAVTACLRPVIARAAAQGSSDAR